jgi:methanogenic corrinoid protein MtbC1
MHMSVTIQEVNDAVWQLKKAKALELVKHAIADGRDPVKVLQKGGIAGPRVVGDKFGAKKYFLAELDRDDVVTLLGG